MGKPLKILGAMRRDNPAFYSRVQAPFGVLDRSTRHDWKIGPVSPSDSQMWDVLWLQQHADYGAVLMTIMFKLAKRLVVYDVDDWLLELPPAWADASAFAKSSERLILHRDYMLRFADIITTTTPYLASKLRGVVGPDKPIAILPNCVLQQDWDAILPQGYNNLTGPVLGWFGTVNHWDDWMEIAPAVDVALDEVNGTLALIGPAELAHCFPARLKARIRHTPPVPFGQMAKVREQVKAFDVGLAWATDRTEASLCRSPLKAYQYGAAGVPCVVSRAVYGEIECEGVRVVENASDLAGVLVDELRQAKCNRAAQWQEAVWREHSYEQCARVWMDMIRDVTGVVG